MQCNIDARGRRLRLISGILCGTIGGALIILALVRDPWSWRLLLGGVGLLALGLFQVFEARKGWCIVRALGFKTPV